MTRPFDIQVELAYQRRVLFAVELVDAVTLQRVSRGAEVFADGLRRTPIVNTRGMFVWCDETLTSLQRLRFEPGMLPYDREEVAAADVTLPVQRIDLLPRASYRIPDGVTALRGRLAEEAVVAPQLPEPVRDARVGLEWKDDNGGWRPAPVKSRSDAATGEFVAILRLTPQEIPELNAGAITVRLWASRPAGTRRSAERKLTPGRVVEPTASDPLIFAWEDLQP